MPEIDGYYAHDWRPVQPEKLSSGDTIRGTDVHAAAIEGKLSSKPYGVSTSEGRKWFYRLEQPEGTQFVTCLLPVERLDDGFHLL